MQRAAGRGAYVHRDDDEELEEETELAPEAGVVASGDSALEPAPESAEPTGEAE